MSETGTTSRSSSFSDTVEGLRGILKGIPDRPGKKLMTFDELQQAIGSKPKKDRFGGLKKMSGRYKAIGQRLEELQDRLSRATVDDLEDEGGRTKFEQDILDQLDVIDDAALNYQKKHKKGRKFQAVQSLIGDVDRFRNDLGPALDELTKGDSAGMPADLPVDQAMAASRNGIKPNQLAGISPKHCNFSMFNDQSADRPSVELGQGAVNKVQRITHGGKDRAFKKEQAVDTSKSLAPAMMGLGQDGHPSYGNRNVAGGVLGKILGTDVMPICEFGACDGDVGLVMDLAPGDTVVSLLKKKAITAQSLSPRALASLKQQLADLEACDILTGQGDRHPGNYMIDIQGDKVTVTGIDNDFSFPTRPDSLGRIPMQFMGVTSIQNLPALMSKGVADKIKALDFDRDVAPQYAGLLKKPELDLAKIRFDTMKNRITELEQGGYIVTDWAT